MSALPVTIVGGYLGAGKTTHEWIVLPGVGHDPMAVIEGLGDRHWAFYRSAFG